MRRLTTGVGLGLRAPFHRMVVAGELPIDFIEVTAEHYFDDLTQLQALQHIPTLVHSLSLSLGSPEALDLDYLEQVLGVADQINAVALSDHLAFTRVGSLDLGHLNPVPLTDDMFVRIAGKIEQIQKRSNRPFLVENITTHLLLDDPLQEAAFLARLAQATDCGLLLDVTNLYVNARNHGFDPIAYLNRLDMKRVQQIHLIGYTERAGRLHDEHAKPVQDELMALLTTVLCRSEGAGVLLEWDRDQPVRSVLVEELIRIRNLGGARLHPKETPVLTDNVRIQEGS